MKGMTSGSYVITAPCAMDSHRISRGICTPSSELIKITETFEKSRNVRCLWRKFQEQSAPAFGCDWQGGMQVACSAPILQYGGSPDGWTAMAFLNSNYGGEL